MNFALVTAATDDIRELEELTLPNKQEYCDRHGYELIGKQPKQPHFIYNKGLGFFKIPWIALVLDKNPELDWVFWLDTDALIMNFNTKLESFVSNEKADFIVTEDGHGMNVGAFFLRNCDWTKRFLANVWDAGQEGENWFTKSEQGKMAMLSELPENQSHVKIYDNSAFNSYVLHYSFNSSIVGRYIETHIYKPGDFVIHLPGTPYLNKIRLVEEYKDEVIR